MIAEWLKEISNWECDNSKCNPYEIRVASKFPEYLGHPFMKMSYPYPQLSHKPAFDWSSQEQKLPNSKPGMTRRLTQKSPQAL